VSLSARFLRAIREKLLRGRDRDPATATHGSRDSTLVAPAPERVERIGRYRIVRRIGQGGMGIVYAAHDEELDRALAIKVIGTDRVDETAIRRFRREARAAAAVNHPHVCQLYEIGEHRGALFIAMELLEGEALYDCLLRGALPVPEAVATALGILSALSALHGRGLVHRDLKPSNVFLTPHGVKLLDFGLARRGPAEEGIQGASELTILTRAGTIVGTPGYMAPEQIRGEAVDARADLFALGAILFEMLSGRPAFGRGEMVEVLYATLHEQPPALSGSSAAVAVDRVIRRLLQKRAVDRPASADAVRSELAAIPLGSRDGQAATQALTRIVVLPFRILRPDPETDFLGLGLADAVSTSLSNLRSIVVRSSAAASGLSSESPDLRRIAAEADVDLVILGTLLRAGDRLRATAQLVEAPAGTVLSASTLEAPAGDVFGLSDDLSRRMVDALAIRLSGRTDGPGSRQQVPATPRAYELYLRANHASLEYDQMEIARDLYLQALEEDPRFAPAWARLGRAYRLIGKFIEHAEENRRRAEAAFQRALELDPDLSIGHKLYAHFETEWGGASRSMERLLSRARARREDAELFAGLVHACRYGGLLDASLAAHQEARRLDPHVRTSVAFTLYLQGDYERLAREGDSVLDLTPRTLGLIASQRRKEALQVVADLGRAQIPRMFGMTVRALRVAVSGDRSEITAVEEATRAHSDPEALYMFAIFFGVLGENERGLEVLDQAARSGYSVSSALERDPLLEPLRGHPRFPEIWSRAEEKRREVQRRFEAAGGPEILGL
jgi:serine/threonine protein kinase